MWGSFRLFKKKSDYEKRKELLRKLLLGEVTIVVPVDVEAMSILEMFEYCVIRQKAREISYNLNLHDPIAYIDSMIEFLANMPENIECDIVIGPDIKQKIKINKNNVLNNLIKILETSKKSHITYLDLLWEAIEMYINDIELKIRQYPMMSKEIQKFMFPGVALGEKARVNLLEMFSEQVYVPESAKHFALGLLLDIARRYLEAVCAVSSRQFRIRKKKVRNSLIIHFIKIYGISEKINIYLKQFDKIINNIESMCSQDSSKIVDAIDELIGKAKRLLIERQF